MHTATASTTPLHGLVLFAHGARDPRWAEPFERVAAAVRSQSPALPVALAFLELMEPTLATAGAALVAKGCTSVTVLPLFLGTGGHVRKDLPLLVDALRCTHGGVDWRLAPAIGEHAAVIAALADVAGALARTEAPTATDRSQPAGGRP